MSRKLNLFSQSDKRQTIEIVANTPNFHVVGPITYPSGNRGPFNVDFAWIFSDPKRLMTIASFFKKIVVKLKVKGIVAIPSLGLPLATAISIQTRLPLLWVRPKPDPRTKATLEGFWRKGMKVVLIDDVIGGAGTKRCALKNIKERLKVTHILAIMSVDKHYRPNWRPWAKKVGIKVNYLFEWGELAKYLIKCGGDKKRDAAKLQLEFLKSPLNWYNEKNLQRLRVFMHRYKLKVGQSF